MKGGCKMEQLREELKDVSKRVGTLERCACINYVTENQIAEAVNNNGLESIRLFKYASMAIKCLCVVGLLSTISTAAAHHKSDKLEKKISDLQNELDILKGVNEKE